MQDPREASVPRRLLARFDFEENATFPMELPAGWARVLSERPSGNADGTNAVAKSREKSLGVPDLPNFGSVKAEAGAGRGHSHWSLRFVVDGASIAVSSDPSRVPVAVGAQIAVTAWARTKDLKFANVRLSLQFCDENATPIGLIYASELLRSESDWRQLRIEPPPAPTGARGVSLWLEVVQPRSLKSSDESRFAVTQPDIAGSALFDDIEVWQMPTVAFEADGLGVVEPGAKATLTLRCNDPASGTTSAVVRVRDATGATVHSASLEVPPDRGVLLEMPQLPTGWYEAESRFSAGNELIANRRARFAVLPRDPFEPDEPPRFGASLGAGAMPIEPAVDLARAAFVVLPIWESTTDTRQSKHEVDLLRVKVAALLDRRVEPMFRIMGVPVTLAREQRIDTADTLALFALEESRWRPTLEPWLLAFGQQVEQWFIADEPVEATRADMSERVETLSRALENAIAGPAIGLPWSPSEPLVEPLASVLNRGRHTLEIVADPAWRESSGEMYAGLPTGPRAMVRIVPLLPGSVDDHERAIDLALRAIDAWRAGIDNIAVDVRAESLPLIPGPPLELAAWRQVSTRLCGRRFVAEIPVKVGIRALLADGPRGPMLAMWNEGAEVLSEVAVDLGTSAVFATDLWGRGSKIDPTARGHLLQVGREPLFVEGVSREMCLLRSGFRANPVFAVARRAAQEGVLVLANPWSVPMSGVLTIAAPDVLGLSPKTHRFTIEALGEARLPVQFRVPRSMAAGETLVRVDIDATAIEPFRASLQAPLEVGYRDVAIESSWRLARSIESGAIDLVLTLKVANVSANPVDIEAFAVADGYTQSKKPITGLAPGATAVRVFHFADGARRLSGRDIRAGVHDAEADARQLRRIAIPPLLPPAESVVGVPDEAAR